MIADPHSYAHWVYGTSSIRGADPEWPALGAKLHHRFGPWLLRTPDHTEVHEVDPPRRILLRANARPWALVWAELTIRPDGTGSRVDFCEQITGGITVHFGRVSTRVQRWRMRRSLERLAELAEG